MFDGPFNALASISRQPTEANFSLEEYTDPETKQVIPTVVKTFPRSKADNFLEVEMHKITSAKTTGVVKFYESYAKNGLLHMRLQYCEQNNLLVVIENRDGKFWLLGELLKMYKELLTTLKTLTDLRIAHRCIELRNILLTSSGDCKLCDFGHAKTIKSNETYQQHTVWNPQMYVSPNLRSGEETQVDPFKEDIWSLGKVFFEMAMLKVYANLNTFPGQILESKVRSGLAHYNSPHLADLLLGMLQKDHSQRPTAAICLSAIESIAGMEERKEESVVLTPFLEEMSEEVIESGSSHGQSTHISAQRGQYPKGAVARPVSPDRPEDEESDTQTQEKCTKCDSSSVLEQFQTCQHRVCANCLIAAIYQHVQVTCPTCSKDTSMNDITRNPEIPTKLKETILRAIQEACDLRLRELKLNSLKTS